MHWLLGQLFGRKFDSCAPDALLTERIKERLDLSRHGVVKLVLQALVDLVPVKLLLLLGDLLKRHELLQLHRLVVADSVDVLVDFTLTAAFKGRLTLHRVCVTLQLLNGSVDRRQSRLDRVQGHLLSAVLRLLLLEGLASVLLVVSHDRGHFRVISTG